MHDFKEILGRMDLRQIRAFILEGVDGSDERDEQTYEERITREEQPLMDLLKKTFPERDEQEKAIMDANRAIAANQDVYAEIGMKAGARLLYQLMRGGEI